MFMVLYRSIYFTVNKSVKRSPSQIILSQHQSIKEADNDTSLKNLSLDIFIDTLHTNDFLGSEN